MADMEAVAATLTAALVEATIAPKAALTDNDDERIRVARQVVVLYETIHGMLTFSKS